MKVNLGGNFYLAQAVANQIIKQNSGGSIIFCKQRGTGHQALKDLAAYATTKAGLDYAGQKPGGRVVALQHLG
jgi:glucose 1-dehydrogenase